MHEHDCLLALSDTCCARSVAGEGWAKAHINHLHEAGLDAYIVDEMRPFRFGAGPKIASKYSVIIPLHVPQASNVPWMRVSIVDQDVPLLLSKSALKALGARLDLGAARVELSKLDTSLDLVETASGLCGFVINREGNKSAVHLPFPPVDMLEGEMEVFMGAPSTPQRPSDLGSAVHVCPQINTEGKHPVLESERLAKECLTAGSFSYQNLHEVVELLPNVNPDRLTSSEAINGGAKRPRSGLMGGLWAHGGFHGVSKTVKKFPYTIKYVNAFTRERCDREHWTSFVVLKNVKTNLHKDNHNAPGSKTITVTFGDFQGGELWIEGGQDGDRAIRKDLTGQWVKGVSVSTKHSPFLLDPKCQHGTQPWTGTRWCLSCYTARSYSNIDASMKASLIELGFPLPTVPATRTFGESSNVCNTSSSHQEPLTRTDEVCSPCLHTPHVKTCSAVAQSESKSIEAPDHTGHERDKTDGQQVCASQEEGGVRERNSSSHELVSSRVAEARRGAIEAHLEHGEAAEAAVTLASGMEENGRGCFEGNLRERSLPRLGKGERSPLDQVEPPSAGDGDRDVACRSDGVSGAGGHVPRRSDVLGVPNSNGDPDKSPDKGRFLWMHPLSSMLSDPTSEVCRPPNESGPGQPPCRDPDRRDQEGAEGSGKGSRSGSEETNREPTGAGRVARATRGVIGWFLGEDRSSAYRRDLRGRGRPEPVQHQRDRGGDEDASADEASQVERREVRSPSEANATAGGSCKTDVGSHFSSEICKLDALPRSPEEIRGRIIEGQERRRAAKRGVVKRLLGNARALAASVLLASSAAIGMAMQSVPQASVIRPDLLEVFAGEAQVTRKFSRWGWSAAEPVDLGSCDDLYDADGRRRLLEWVDQCQPRLIVLTYPRKVWLNLNRVQSQSSQESRRIRKLRERDSWVLS